MRMTKEEMRQKYPKQWLGLKDPICPEGSTGVLGFITAEVVYTDEDRDQLLKRQLSDKEPIFSWYTGPLDSFDSTCSMGAYCSSVIIYDVTPDGQKVKVAELY